MRTLFVLRGAPGAGKSTLIRHHGLTDLAVGLDDLRRLYSANLADLDGQPALSMSFGSEKRVVAAFKEVVTARIRQGATLVLDCTNPARKAYRDTTSLGLLACCNNIPSGRYSVSILLSPLCDNMASVWTWS